MLALVDYPQVSLMRRLRPPLRFLLGLLCFPARPRLISASPPFLQLLEEPSAAQLFPPDVIARARFFNSVRLGMLPAAPHSPALPISRAATRGNERLAAQHLCGSVGADRSWAQKKGGN